jgi:hypothetical protein
MERFTMMVEAYMTTASPHTVQDQTHLQQTVQLVVVSRLKHLENPWVEFALRQHFLCRTGEDVD